MEESTLRPLLDVVDINWLVWAFMWAEFCLEGLDLGDLAFRKTLRSNSSSESVSLLSMLMESGWLIASVLDSASVWDDHRGMDALRVVDGVSRKGVSRRVVSLQSIRSSKPALTFSEDGEVLDMVFSSS